jgi:hypothetical protein
MSAVDELRYRFEMGRERISHAEVLRLILKEELWGEGPHGVAATLNFRCDVIRFEDGFWFVDRSATSPMAHNRCGVCAPGECCPKRGSAGW